MEPGVRLSSTMIVAFELAFAVRTIDNAKVIPVVLNGSCGKSLKLYNDSRDSMAAPGLLTRLLYLFGQRDMVLNVRYVLFVS